MQIKIWLFGAIQYCLNQWEKLQRYTLDGRRSIDNNRAERAIKPFVMGRRYGYSHKQQKAHSLVPYCTRWWNRLYAACGINRKDGTQLTIAGHKKGRTAALLIFPTSNLKN